jgi:hypothetical protein
VTRPVQQCVYRGPIVHPLTTPTRHCRARIDSYATFGEVSDYLRPVATRGVLRASAALSGLMRWDRRGKRASVPHSKPERAVIEHLNIDAALMHLAMMEAALCRPPDYADREL